MARLASLLARREEEVGAPNWDSTEADPTAIVPDEQGPEADRLLHQALGRHTFLGEAALVVAWALFSVVIFHFLTVNRTLAWLFVFASAVMVAVILVFRRVAERRIRLGLHDAGVALRSIQSVTDPGLSFLPLDALLDELLARTGHVVGGDVAAIFLVSAEGTSLTVRASYGLDARITEGLEVLMGEGVVGEVASRAQAVIVNDVAEATETSPLMRQRVSSLVAAPLLVGGQVIGVVQVGTRVRHRFQERDLQLLQLVADRTAASIERARLDEAERRSRLGAEHARQHVAILARAGDVLATALESYDEAMVRLVDVVVPAFADWFAVDVVDEQGTLRRVADGADGRWDTAARRHPHPDGEALVRRVLASGRPEVVIHTRRAGPPHGGEPALPGTYRETDTGSGIESMVVVPVHLRGLSFGALSFVTGTGRRGYRRSDLETAAGLAERVAIAVERVLLWGESRQAEQAATRHAGQLRRLMEAALAVNAPLAEPQVLRVLSEHGRRVLDAEQAVVLTLSPGDLPPDADETAERVEVSAPAAVPDSLAPVVQAASRLVAGANRPLRDSGGLDEGGDPVVAAALASSGGAPSRGWPSRSWIRPGPATGPSSSSAGNGRSTPRTNRSSSCWPRWPRWPSTTPASIKRSRATSSVSKRWWSPRPWPSPSSTSRVRRGGGTARRGRCWGGVRRRRTSCRIVSCASPPPTRWPAPRSGACGTGPGTAKRRWACSSGRCATTNCSSCRCRRRRCWTTTAR